MGQLSDKTKSLINIIADIQNQTENDDAESINISKTVSFFAIVYERFRNVIEFKDDHIIRRNAINRIISRRLAFNPTLKDESASIAKEIAWAGYFKKDKIPETAVDKLERTIDWYIVLKNKLTKGFDSKSAKYNFGFVKELLICQIEEIFSKKEQEIERNFLFYYYQVLNPFIKIQGISKENKDLYFYIAVEQTFLKSDKTYLRYSLFKLIFEHLLLVKPEEMTQHLNDYQKAFKFIDKHIDKGISHKVTRYLRNIRPSYLVLKELVINNRDKLADIFTDENKLKNSVDSICRDKYALSKEKLTRAGIRSIAYIFFTKVIFVFIAEYPIIKTLGQEIDYLSLAINALFPPVLMAMFVIFTSIPDEQNTKKIFNKVKTIVYKSNPEEIHFKNKKEKEKNFVFSAMFWSFYFATFAITFSFINYVLDLFSFHLTSKIIFFFFIASVSFFGYRIRQAAKEYVMKEKDNVFSPIFDFFLMPLVSVGKWLSSEVSSKFSMMLFVIDFVIEAPFKILFEVIEEWISFVRRRKEDII
jgi:hypothetical protein